MTLLRRASPWVLALFLLLAGINHFLSPGFYDSFVPGVLGPPRPWVAASGVAEIACAALLVVPATRRTGALATFALFVLVFPGNVNAVLQAEGTGETSLAVLRLPFQVPLLLWAWQVRQAAAGATGAARRG